MLTEVQVEAHAKNGICVSFMKGVYRGAIDEDHLGGHRGVDEGKKKHLDKESGDPIMWWKNVFKGKHAKVRFIYVVLWKTLSESSHLNVMQYPLLFSDSLPRVSLQWIPLQRSFDFRSTITSLP